MDVGVKKDTLLKVFAYVIVGILAFVSILPLLYVIVISFSDSQSIKELGYSLIPNKWTLTAYEMLIDSPNAIIRAYGVTITITAVGTVVGIFISALYAYGLSRKSFLLRRQLSFFLYFTMLFSGGMVPIYILVTRYLGLRNNILAMILPYLVTPSYIFLMRTFIQSIPDSLFEAAKLDGASEFRILFSVVFPISKGGIATVTLFSLLGFWNSWYPCMLYIDNAELYSLQYLLHTIMTRFQNLRLEMEAGMLGGDLAAIPMDSIRMATCVLAIGPLVIAFPFFQKYFVKGIAVGSVKG